MIVSGRQMVFACYIVDGAEMRSLDWYFSSMDEFEPSFEKTVSPIPQIAYDRKCG